MPLLRHTFRHVIHVHEFMRLAPRGTLIMRLAALNVVFCGNIYPLFSCLRHFKNLLFVGPEVPFVETFLEVTPVLKAQSDLSPLLLFVLVTFYIIFRKPYHFSNLQPEGACESALIGQTRTYKLHCGAP